MPITLNQKDTIDLTPLDSHTDYEPTWCLETFGDVIKLSFDTDVLCNFGTETLDDIQVEDDKIILFIDQNETYWKLTGLPKSLATRMETSEITRNKNTIIWVPQNATSRTVSHN